MHILAIEGWPTLLAGGQERSLFEVICGLRSQAVDVTLAYEQEGELVAEYQRRGVHTFQIVTRALVLKSWRSPVYIWRFAVSLWRILVQNRRARGAWTLIYINQYFDVTLAIVCGVILRLPVVCHLRNAPSHYMSRQFRWGLRRCKLLICNSSFTAKSYSEIGVPSERIVVLHNAIDTNVFCPAEGRENELLTRRASRHVLYVGRISPEKGIEILVEAVAIVRQHDPRITLLVIGNARGTGSTDSYRESLRSFAESRLGSGVEFRSATPDVLPFYRSADLTVLPSLWDEPFGRVIIESMACGIPCVASRGGGVPEILAGNLGLLMFNRGSAEDLASRLRSLIDWRTESPGLSRLCRERVLTMFSDVAMRERLSRMLDAAQASSNGLQ